MANLKIAPVERRKITKNITANASTAPLIRFNLNRRIHSLWMTLTYAGGTNTLAGLATALSEIRVLAGTIVLWRLSGTKLRDFVLNFGTTHDWNGVPNTGAEIRLSFAPEWLFAGIANLMALNPAKFGAPLSVEITSTATLTVDAWEFSSDDLGVDSPGYLGLQVISPVLGGTTASVTDPIKPVGRLLMASIYPDGGAVATTTAGFYLGPQARPIVEEVTSEINLDMLETNGFTPTASGRTASVFDLALADGDALDEAPDLSEGSPELRVTSAGYGAAAAIVLARLVRYGENYAI